MLISEENKREASHPIDSVLEAFEKEKLDLSVPFVKPDISNEPSKPNWEKKEEEEKYKEIFAKDSEISK